MCLKYVYAFTLIRCKQYYLSFHFIFDAHFKYVGLKPNRITYAHVKYIQVKINQPIESVPHWRISASSYNAEQELQVVIAFTFDNEPIWKNTFCCSSTHHKSIAIATKMPIKRKDRENSNETNCIKSYRMDHLPTDHELFLQAFESKYTYNTIKYSLNEHITARHGPITTHLLILPISEPTQIYRYLRSRNRLSVSIFRPSQHFNRFPYRDSQNLTYFAHRF